MTFRSSISFLVLAITGAAMAPGPALGDTHRIPIAGGPSELTLVAETREALTFRVEVGELTGFDVTTPAGDFTRLLIPGFHASKAAGAPELPMMNRLFALPSGARARIEILSTRTRTIDLGAYGITARLLPAQPSMPKNADPATWPFVYDPAAYDVDRAGHDLVQVEELGLLRGVDFARVDVVPVEYFPRTNQIRVAEALEFSLVFDGADHAATQTQYRSTWSPFFLPVYGQLAGFRGIHDNYPDLVRDVVTLVIVTPPEFVSTLAGFIDWKTQRGFHVVVGVRGTPEVGTTADQIKTYLHNLYNNPPPGIPAPSFVLLVGDVEQIPTFTRSASASDRPYCAVTPDLVPDMYYGRLPATSPSQLQTMLDKTLTYDQFTMPDPSYLGEVVMIAGMDSNYGQVWANGQINYGTSLYFNAAHGILSHTYLYPASGGQAAAIVQDVSDGAAYVNYTAHGSQTSWSNPPFTQANVNSLQNAGKYCLAVGNCCLAASYQIPECFAETWLRAPNKGAIGYIGGSNNTYWDEDYWWGVGYGTVVEFPTYAGNLLGSYDGVFHDHGEAMAQWYVTNDALIFAGNLAVMESGSSRTTYYWDIYNLTGDPTLSCYLGVPAVNPVTHPATLFTNTTAVTVAAAPGSYVGLTQDAAIAGAGTVDESGSLTLTLTRLLTPGTARLVVTAQNKEPYVADLDVQGATTGVDEPGTALPSTVALGGNVPNPFNPATRIQFELPRPSAVDLAVFDLGGRRVATLASELWPAGRHQVLWRGRDTSGDRAASGLYFYRLAADGQTLTRTMLLLK